MHAANTRWVIVEIKEQLGEMRVEISPLAVKVPRDFTGQIIWYVFTEGWRIDEVQLATSIPDWGSPEADWTRPHCWRLQADGPVPEPTAYAIFLRDPNGHLHRIDPVIENEPPPTIAAGSESERVVAVA